MFYWKPIFLWKVHFLGTTIFFIPICKTTTTMTCVSADYCFFFHSSLLNMFTTDWFFHKALLSYIDSNESHIRKYQQLAQCRRYFGHLRYVQHVALGQGRTHLYHGSPSRAGLEVEGPLHVKAQREDVGMCFYLRTKK